jgi:spermidine/putrescine ABC transporter ATP-binding subunit
MSEHASEQAPIIQVSGITKRYPGGVMAVNDVSLDIGRGEFFALLGPSGCGKTTLLRMIAGFEVPTGGDILIDGESVVGVPPNKRPINMVFQSYAVFPHMTVQDNVAYGLRMDGVPPGERNRRAEEALEMVKLGGYGSRLPSQLSGGQRQRVALARALVKRPKVLLLDEPLSALDAKLREAMQIELVRLQQQVGITFVIVTHDQEEALSMANRIAVMEKGVVRQVAPPAELYEFPNCRFVADFIGKMNLFEGKVVGLAGQDVVVDVKGIGRVDVPAIPGIEGEIGVAVRPEKLRLDRDHPATGRIAFRGQVSDVAYHGDSSWVFIRDEAGHTLMTAIQNEERSTQQKVAVGDQVWCSWSPGDTLLLRE